MKKIFVASAILFNSFAAIAQKTADPVDKKVDALIAKMTLEEKIGQMTQVTLAEIVQSGGDPASPQIDMAKVREAITKYHVGSFLNVTAGASSRETWYKIISDVQKAAAEDRLKIPVIYGIDAIHGVTYTSRQYAFSAGNCAWRLLSTETWL